MMSIEPEWVEQITYFEPNFGVNGGEIEGDFGVFGTSDDYNALKNKPQINSVELSGNRSWSDLGLDREVQIVTNQEIDDIIFGGN